jgi:peptidoglycan lytic transglycosylase
MLGTGGQYCQMARTSIGEPTEKRAYAALSGRSFWSQIRIGFVALAAVSFVAACSSAPTPEKAKFSPKKYGVKGSPRMVASGKPVPKGGGRYVTGKKYKIAGKWYYPKHEPNYKKTGLASWYGPTFHGRKTANGEIFDRTALTAAHTTMPLPSYARVTNVSNGRSMIVRVNDRGPFHGNRIIDLSERVANMLGTKSAGVGKVKVEYIGKAPLHGQDEAYLMASYQGPGAVQPGATRPGTMLAQVDPQLLRPTPQIVFGKVPPPSPRPYLSAPTYVTAYQAPSQTHVAAAFDPAIAFEAGARNIKVASNNGFQPPVSSSAPATSPGEGTLGVLRIPAPATPSNIQPGSAISSFSANKRISDAHSVLAVFTPNGLSMRQLASHAQSVE